MAAMKKDIPKIVKRVVNKNLTYCLKNGKNIVPDEYLDKGKSGIEEWRTLKSSQNKNNSMEKRIIKEALREKKNYMIACIETAMRNIVDVNTSWEVPALSIDGRWNAGKVKKLSTQLFKDKSNQQIIEMSEEDVLAIVKEYWKKLLNDAYKEVSKIECSKK